MIDDGVDPEGDRIGAGKAQPVLGDLAQPARGLRLHARRVEADADRPHVGAGQPRRGEIGLQALGEIGQGAAGNAAHMRPSGLMAQHQRLGLRAVEEPQRHAREGGMEERALAFDQIPAVVGARRRELLDRAGDEIGDDGIDRHALAGDQDAGLAGRPEIGGDAALAQAAGQRDRRDHLADRAIGADGEQAVARPRIALADRQADGRIADVEQPQARAAARARRGAARRAAAGAGPKPRSARPPAPPPHRRRDRRRACRRRRRCRGPASARPPRPPRPCPAAADRASAGNRRAGTRRRNPRAGTSPRRARS